MSKPIFVRKSNKYGEILPSPEVPNAVICIWRRKVFTWGRPTRWFSETILLPAFDVDHPVAADVAEALYMAANFAAQITGKRPPGKKAGSPGLRVPSGFQVFRNDSRFVIGLERVSPDQGGGTLIHIPAHRSLDIASAAQFARVIYQACDAAKEAP